GRRLPGYGDRRSEAGGESRRGLGGGRFVGSEADELGGPLLDRTAGGSNQRLGHEIGIGPLQVDLDGPPGHAPSASLSRLQKLEDCRGGSPSTLASSSKRRFCSSERFSGVQRLTRTLRSPWPFCPRRGSPFPLSRSTVPGWMPAGTATCSSP